MANRALIHGRKSTRVYGPDESVAEAVVVQSSEIERVEYGREGERKNK